MDKSKTHIALADCPEIQDGWEKNIGDNFAFVNLMKTGEYLTNVLTELQDDVVMGIGGIPYITSYGGCKTIFLPSQAQYWDMLEKIDRLKHAFSALQIIQSFYQICSEDFLYYGQFTSNEQLLCAVFMREYHGKERYSDKWILNHLLLPASLKDFSYLGL